MIKNSWYCCDKCGQKILKITKKSNMNNTPIYCKKCKCENIPTIVKGVQK